MLTSWRPLAESREALQLECPAQIKCRLRLPGVEIGNLGQVVRQATRGPPMQLLSELSALGMQWEGAREQRVGHAHGNTPEHSTDCAKRRGRG